MASYKFVLESESYHRRAAKGFGACRPRPSPVDPEKRQQLVSMLRVSRFGLPGAAAGEVAFGGDCRTSANRQRSPAAARDRTSGGRV